jgi:hypothetical protein
MAQQHLVGQGLLIIKASRSHSDTPHSDSSGRGTSPSQRPLPDSTQHSRETDIHVHGGIRTRNPSKRTAADPRLRTRGQWVRQHTYVRNFIWRKHQVKIISTQNFGKIIVNGRWQIDVVMCRKALLSIFHSTANHTPKYSNTTIRAIRRLRVVASIASSATARVLW